MADSTGCVDGFRPGIGTDDADTLAEPARRFHAERVVRSSPAVLHKLDIAEALVWTPRRGAADRPWNTLVGILEALKVTALPTQVPDLECPVARQLSLNVEEVLHDIGSVVVGGHRIREGGRHVGDRAAAAGDGIAVEKGGGYVGR